MNNPDYAISVFVLSLLTLGGVLLSHGAADHSATDPRPIEEGTGATKDFSPPRLEERLNAIAITVATPYSKR